jgi:hypothetical protein
LNSVPPVAENVTEVPIQNELSASELVSPGTGKEFIVTIMGVLVELTQPDAMFLVAA